MRSSHLADATARWLGRPRWLFLKSHIAFVIVSTLDVIFTWIVLSKGGTEVNPFAAAILDDWGEKGFFGLTLYKFLLVALVVIICEDVGRRRYRTGRGLAYFAVGITSVPVIAAIAQLTLAAHLQ